MHAQLADEPGDAVGDDARLARPGAGENQERSVAVGHGFALLGIESGEVDHEEMRS